MLITSKKFLEDEKMAKTMEQIKKELSVRTYAGMMVVFPQFQKEESLNLDWAPKFNGCYAVNNSTVALVSDGELFVTPYTADIMDALNEAGFHEEYFYVPFSNWDYPKFEKVKWDELTARAKAVEKIGFAKECEDYCDKHNIRELSEETLKNCFKMPEIGVKVTHMYFETCYYPVIRSEIFDCTVAENIGKFCMNNGRVVFVYRTGETFVTKGYKIIKELQEAGYTQAGLFVPFSNGEEIRDWGLKARWDSIKK